ncbi:MAG: zinc metallopeptidase [Saprospiraceae bacterium]|nr:zinc metallopeptidase [Saprospiraceae bacterium]
MGYIVITGIATVIGMIVQGRLKSKFQKYSQIPISSGMTGRDIAEAMLRHYGISDVHIEQGQGMLTDHYNPMSKTVSLSPAIYGGRSIMAAAVAAHECGHAVQHATAYPMLQMRSNLVPIVQIASGLQQYLLIAIFMFSLNSPTLLLVAIGVFGVTALFSLVTLPVEFDASNRALVWLKQTGTTRGQEYDGAKDALKWAAMTYVAAALAALVSLIYLVMRYMSTRD